MKPKFLVSLILGLALLLTAIGVLPQMAPQSVDAQGSGLPMNYMMASTKTPVATSVSGTPSASYLSAAPTPANGIVWSDPLYAGDRFEHPKMFEAYYNIIGSASVTNTYTMTLQISPDKVNWYNYDGTDGNMDVFDALGNNTGYISGTIQGVWVRVKWSQASTPTIYPDIWIVTRGETGKY